MNMLLTEDTKLNDVLNKTAFAGVPLHKTLRLAHRMGFTELTIQELSDDRMARLQYYSLLPNIFFH